jgi:hypothetical protein
MCTRWTRSVFTQNAERISEVADWDAIRVALPQDEFISSDLLCNFINQMRIDGVFSVSPPSEWPAIYDGVDRSRVRFQQVLTGYLDDRTLDHLRRIAKPDRPRPIDIGYRTAGRPYPSFGRHGCLKQDIAEIFEEKAPARGLNVDISTSRKDTLTGDRWFKFLLDCKYTIGVESGTSIHDRDGTLFLRSTAYTKLHPEARYAEVEAACFPGIDGKFRLFALGPRHLEACATRTCQVLTEGEYNGILKPGIHYVELKKDFSNIDPVLDTIASGNGKKEMVERAYEEIASSGRYSYSAFVNHIVTESMSMRGTKTSQ